MQEYMNWRTVFAKEEHINFQLCVGSTSICPNRLAKAFYIFSNVCQVVHMRLRGVQVSIEPEVVFVIHGIRWRWWLERHIVKRSLYIAVEFTQQPHDSCLTTMRHDAREPLGSVVSNDVRPLSK